MKNILVTGATGFVGSHFVDYLLSLDEKIKIYVTKRYHLSKLDNLRHVLDKINFVDCDLTDPVATNSLIKNLTLDEIYHFAAESFVSPSWLHPSRYMSVNYNATVNLLDAIREYSPKTKILLPGSGEEYGEIYEHELPINEKTVLRPVNPYAVTKIAQDLIGYVYFKSYDTQVYRCRTFNHEGPRREKVFGISSYAYQIAKIEHLKLDNKDLETGDTSDLRNFTHVLDIVRAYYMCLQKCEPGELYVIGSESDEYIFTFKQALEMLIELSTEKGITHKQVEKYTRPTNVPLLIADTSKYRDLTKWEPKISFETILKDTLNYWRKRFKDGTAD